MILSLSLSAEVTLALHNLNSEGVEGNQQQTRMVHVIDPNGKHYCVNAISGDMFKHIYVQHLTAVLKAMGEPLSSGAAIGSPDRITVDAPFKAAIKGRTAPEVQSQMLERCAVTDIAGTLFTEGITVARKSCAEFGWLVGISGESANRTILPRQSTKRSAGKLPVSRSAARGRSPVRRPFSIAPPVLAYTR